MYSMQIGGEERITGRTARTLEDLAGCWKDQNYKELHKYYYSPDIHHDGYDITKHHMDIACITEGIFKHTKILMRKSGEKMLLWLRQR